MIMDATDITMCGKSKEQASCGRLIDCATERHGILRARGQCLVEHCDVWSTSGSQTGIGMRFERRAGDCR